MSWLLIVVAAHLLNAVVFVVDKILLGKFIAPRVYTMLVGLLGIVVFAAAPWGLVRPTWLELTMNLGVGVLFMVALLLFNFILSKYEASRIVPVVGGAVPAFTFVLAYLFLDERLAGQELLAFALLVVGTVMLTMVGKSKERVKFTGILLALAAGLAFAVSFVLSKFVYDTQPFLSAFIWTRLGSFLLMVMLLLSAANRKALVQTVKKVSVKIKLLFLGQILIGAVAFLLLNYAIAVSSVSLVNALQGVQYAFLIVLVIVGSIVAPKLIKERLNGWLLVQKIIAIVFVSAGIALVAL